MQYPVVPILRRLSTADWASSQGTNARASVTAVAGVSEFLRAISAERRRRIVEIGVLGSRGRPLGPIEGVDYQHRVARLGQPLAHLPECGTQLEDIRPHEHSRMAAR